MRKENEKNLSRRKITKKNTLFDYFKNELEA